MKKVAIYIRVSTIEQAREGFSIGAQKDRLVKYCQAKGWNIKDIYIDDGYTGTNTDRPALKSMLEKLNDIDIVLVYKLDRLSRSQKDVLYLVEEKFLSNNVDFVSLMESFDTTTPFGRAMLGILAVFAQLERDTIVERSKLGKEKRAKEGLWRGGGNTPIGYKFENNELIIDDYEASQVKRIFDLYLKGKGYNTIAKEMIDKGYKKNNGKDWSCTQVRRVLTNKTYTGLIEHDEEYYNGNHEAIIEKEVFDTVQDIINKKSRKGTSTKYLLGGLVYCGYCGGRLRASWSTPGKGGRKYYHYLCYSVVGAPTHMVKDHNCQGKTWEMGKLDNIVISALKQKSLDIKELKKAYDYKTVKAPKPINPNFIKDKIEKIDKQISRLMDLYQDDKVPMDIVSERIEKLYIQKKSLESTNISMKDKSDGILPFEQYAFWLENFDDIWNEANYEEKRVILSSFIKKITVTDAVHITFSF
ncbi:recombinase family protein [Brassicibacter mesophilus]|uniref:recombinase family protein n=1 Tax=Brassicibacter mesophilus TaxID=745119 RepID=UPI003D243DF7